MNPRKGSGGSHGGPSPPAEPLSTLPDRSAPSQPPTEDLPDEDAVQPDAGWGRRSSRSRPVTSFPAGLTAASQSLAHALPLASRPLLRDGGTPFNNYSLGGPKSCSTCRARLNRPFRPDPSSLRGAGDEGAPVNSAPVPPPDGPQPVRDRWRSSTPHAYAQEAHCGRRKPALFPKEPPGSEGSAEKGPLNPTTADAPGSPVKARTEGWSRGTVQGLPRPHREIRRRRDGE